MAKLNIEICPETGLCSILKGDGTKVDLMPDEVESLRQAAGKPEVQKQILAEVDAGFAEKLDAAELKQVSAEIK
jgi:hypothetical protein